MTNEAQPRIVDLTKALKGDLNNKDIRWECETQIDIILTLREKGHKKLEYL